MGNFITQLYGGDTGSGGGITQFEMPSSRASADAQMPVGNTPYAVELGTATAHAQTASGVMSRISGQLKNPTTEPFNLHMMLIVGFVIVALILIHRAFKGSVI
jgi:hypothetical protein